MNPIYFYDNDVAEFTYTGGSNPGSKRHVCVICHEGNLVRCWDFDKDERRTFDDRKIQNVVICTETKYFDCQSLPSCVSPNQVEEGFQDEGYNTFRNDKGWIIAAKFTKPIVISMAVYQVYKNKQEVYLNVGDKCIVFYIDGNKLTVQGSHGIIKYETPTVDQLKEVLSSVGL